MTVKSDDIVGRVKTYEAIVKGQNVPKPGVPESFKVLIKELQSLGLDVKVLDHEGEEIDLKQTFDDDDDVVGIPVQLEEDLVADTMDGFSMEDDEGNPITEEDADDFAMDDFADDLDQDEQY